MSLSQEVNWYQDSNSVTASLKITQKNLRNYRAEFNDTGFSVFADDGLLWECKLCGKIVPKRCKLRAGSVRLEIKLRKQDPGTWSDYCGRNDNKVYNPVKVLSQSDGTVSTPVDDEASLPPPSISKDTSPPLLSPDNPEDSISNSTNANSRPDTANSVPYSVSSTPDTTDSIPDNANSIPGTANSVLDIADSVPDIVDSIPHSANSIPDTTNSVPDIEATNTVPTSSLEPKLDHEPASLAPDLDATVADPAVDQDTVFIDYMNQPDPLEQLNRSQRKDAEPRRAAGSFEITGADPIATSGDHAIDSNDVAVAPEANEDTELEISHLVHDWMDKIPSPVVEVVIPIRSFDANSLRVRFFVDSFKVIFKTRAEMFLKITPGATEDSYIYWKPKLFGKIVPKESKHWVKMPKLYIQLKKSPPLQRWKSLEAPSSPTPPTQPTVMDIPPSPRMGSSIQKECSTLDKTPIRNSHSENTIKPVSNAAQNVTKPVEKKNSLPLAGGAGTAAAAVKVGTAVKLAETSCTGLINIGNTCYMNSIIQSLSNTCELRDYLINGTFIKERNTTNVLGYKGKLVDAFASLLKKLWTGKHEKLSPHSILNLVASKYNQFTERSQHDAHEFMSFLLDGLHEDVNRVVVKPSTAAVEQNNRPDQVVAHEAWEVYRKRNDSFIVDTFQGQFKSTLHCTKCAKMSVTFDPFSCLAVPLPKKMRLLSVFLMRKDPSITPVKYVFKLPQDSTLEMLKASIGKKAGILIKNLRMFEAYKGKMQVAIYNNRMSIDRIGDKDVIIVSEVLSEQEAGEEVIEISVLQRILMPFHPTTCALCKESGNADSLKRCTKCLAVAYCNRTCQEEHWKSEHSVMCLSQRQPPTVGVPFIVSLPKSQCTYKNLANAAEKFARHSVNVERALSSSNSSTSDIIGGSTTADLAEQKSPPPVNNDASEERALSSSLSSSSSSSSSINHSSSPSMDTSDGATSHGHVEEVPIAEKPKFLFTPVNRFGNTVKEGEHLENTGEGMLNLHNVKFLAIDWRNSPKMKGHVKVTENKSFYDEDSSCSTTHTDEIESGPATLQKCLHLFTVPETLSSDEAWYCPKCKEHREAIKQMSLWRLPKILIIQLKRFTYQKCIWKDKIDKDVFFPLKELDMSKYVEENALNDTSVTNSPPVYDLYATVNHFGSVFFGHYTAYVQSQEDDKWLLYDDDTVRKCKAAEVNNQHAYLLFYRMRNN